MTSSQPPCPCVTLSEGKELSSCKVRSVQGPKSLPQGRARATEGLEMGEGLWVWREDHRTFLNNVAFEVGLDSDKGSS